MLSFAFKTLISALIIALASAIAKRSTALAALIIALPLNSILAFSLVYVDTGDAARVARLSQSVMLLIVPSLLYFVAMPLLLKQGLGYWPATGLAAGGTVLANWGWLWILRGLGIAL